MSDKPTQNEKTNDVESNSPFTADPNNPPQPETEEANSARPNPLGGLVDPKLESLEDGT
jgi:hypothetical protein